MKVAFIMSRFPKITETFILYEILELERIGVQAEVYPLMRERQPVLHREAEAMVERAHFHPFLSLPILAANWRFLRTKPRTYLRTLLEVLRGTWGSSNFFVGAIGLFPKAVRFAYEMERQGIEHVHAHFATHPTVAALVIHRLTGIPYSFTAHGSDLHVDRRMLDQKVAAAAMAVTCSNFNKEVMVRECGEDARDKIHVVHYGVDLDVFTPRDRPHAPGPYRIVCVASFEEVKGHKYLVEACRMLAERGVDFTCDLVGEGPQRDDVTKRVADSGLESRFVFHGAVQRPDVVRLLGSADVKVLASFPTKGGKREGMPNVLIEAMAAGLPVVSTQLTGIPELVDSGRTGILVPPADAAALAEALETLSRDGELRRRMGVAGRERVLRLFDRRTNALALARLFGLKLPGQGQEAPRAQPTSHFGTVPAPRPKRITASAT